MKREGLKKEYTDNKKEMRAIFHRKKEEEKARWKAKIAGVKSESTFWELVRK